MKRRKAEKRPASRVRDQAGAGSLPEASRRGPPARGLPARPEGWWSRFTASAEKQVDGSALAVIRIAVGLIMALEAWSLLRPSASTSGQVMLDTYFTGPAADLNLPYAWFQWLPLLPMAWLHRLVWVLGLAALAMAAGFCYRFAATTVFLAWGYLYAVEATRTYWMSYYYLELLICFLLIWMPAARRYSLDARLRKGRQPDTVPAWTILLLRAQLVITYFYAGLAKLNADWLLDAVPVRNFLRHPSVIKRFEPWLGPAQLHGLTDILHSNGLAYFLSYAGALFDLSVGFLLLARRTRLIGLGLLLIFHSSNHFILFPDLVWFPLLGIATATIFLGADWPERAWRWFREERGRPRPQKAKGQDGLGEAHADTRTSEEGLREPASALRTRTSALLARKWGAIFTVSWIAWQVLLPLRHYLIPGDGRFTWEGLSFSWRLKTETYSSSPCEISLRDPGLISRDASGQIQIDWNQWHGDRVIYRTLGPGRINYSVLPEVLVLSEPEIGERIIYNPLGNPGAASTEAEARARVAAIWQEAYGRQPQNVRPTMSVWEIVDGYVQAIKAKGGQTPERREESLAMILQTRGRRGDRQMIPFLRRMHPFELEQPEIPAGPFLLIEDPLLFQTARGVPEVDRKAWKSASTGNPGPAYRHVGGEPLLIHTAAMGFDTRSIYPKSCVVDVVNRGNALPVISWDYLRELSLSKGMHISTQPFLLRRYARRVASEWEREYHRRPAVHARTAVSLNGRPAQDLVDPDADLAAVPAHHFRHNAWIRDLELRRIPDGSR